MDRTPEQMNEDATMWARAGYPAVAVSRYRDAADQIRRLTAENARLNMEMVAYREKLTPADARAMRAVIDALDLQKRYSAKTSITNSVPSSSKLAESKLRDGSALCEDCPPVGYPTDATRCTPCPRRATQSSPAATSETPGQRS